MVSSHIVRGRRNLASNAIWLMRSVGMQAFQTVLLPSVLPEEVQRLNHLGPDDLRARHISAKPSPSRKSPALLGPKKRRSSMSAFRTARAWAKEK